MFIRCGKMNSPCDCAVEIFGLTPFSNALQTEYVIAIGQYTESMFPIHFLGDYLEANAARFVL